MPPLPRCAYKCAVKELEAELAKAGKRIADGAESITRLQAKIHRLQREGKDISEARKLLGEYHAAQLKLAVEQERLQKALGQIIKK